MNRAIILASASPRRKAALAVLGLASKVVPADIDETLLPNERPTAAALRLAAAKARTVAARHPEDWVLAADTIVIGPDGNALGKPVDAAEAASRLRELRGVRHQVVTAQAVVHHGQLAGDHLRTLVTMRNYTDLEIAAYVKTGDSLDKAGSYGIQHPTFRPVRSIDGCFLNVVGLPLCRSTELLQQSGLPGPLPKLQPPWCTFCRQAAAGEILL